MAERLFYIHGEASADLQVFTYSLMNIITGQTPEVACRTDKVQRQYIRANQIFGEEKITDRIKSRMLGNMIALLENDYPYDGIMPNGGETHHEGGSLAHYCLWSTNSAFLIPEYIDKILNINFVDKPALVFIHGNDFRSIKQLDHSHIIVDMMGEKPMLMQRYFGVEDLL